MDSTFTATKLFCNIFNDGLGTRGQQLFKSNECRRSLVPVRERDAKHLMNHLRDFAIADADAVVAQQSPNRIRSESFGTSRGGPQARHAFSVAVLRSYRVRRHDQSFGLPAESVAGMN